MTYTYAVLEVSQAAYDEIANLLREHGYGHVFDEVRGHGTVIDMHGIALAKQPQENAMKTYIGTKIIAAEPQTHDDGREGYQVIYPDGYVSWSPRETFEQAYREVSDKERGLIADGTYGEPEPEQP